MERASIETFMLAVVRQLRGHTSLDGTAAVCSVTGYEEGQIAFRGKTYRGFTLTTAIVEKFETANDYGP